MKTKVPFILCILAIITSLFSFVSCKKEKPTYQQDQTMAINTEDLKLSRMIELFKEKGKSHFKDDEKMLVDSALWYLEATANYTYGDASQETEETSTDSAFITIQISNDSILLNEVYTQYEIMIDSIREYYQSIPDEEKQLIIVEVEPYSLSEFQLTCKATYTFATGLYPNSHLCDFNPIDSWAALGAVWNGGGICSGPNIGMYPDHDAATEIQSKVMLCKAVPVGNYWFEDPITFDLFAWDYSNPAWNGIPNYYEFRMYCNNSLNPGFHSCLSPEECNFYLLGTKWVLYTSILEGGARPEGKSLSSVIVEGDALYVGPPNWETIYFHHALATYGILRYNPNPPSPL